MAVAEDAARLDRAGWRAVPTASRLASAPFRPAWWARSGLLQTAFAGTPSHRGAAPQTERWDTPDGDFVRVHRWPGAPQQPVLLLLHGLEGGLASRYVGEFVRLLAPLGWQFVLLEFRSCGPEPNRLLRSYHSGETGDLAFVVARLVAEAPARPLFVVGYSLGGNVLLKYLGEQADNAPASVVAAAAVSPPFDLEVAARNCDRRASGAIARHFLRTLVPKAIAKARAFPGVLDESAVRRCRSFAAFDELVTAPLHGFANAEDYWRRSSCAQFLPAIRRPSLLVAAADDPLVPGHLLPHAAVAASPFLHARFEARGGHCGFCCGGSPWRPRRWAEALVLRFFTAQGAARPCAGGS